jgi:hypothetical protein
MSWIVSPRTAAATFLGVLMKLPLIRLERHYDCDCLICYAELSQFAGI